MELNGPSASSFMETQNQSGYGEFHMVLALSRLKMNSFSADFLTWI
jgi:hypothetical protein